MVMFGERLRELVAGPLVRRDDATHDAGALEDREVAIGGALRQPGTLTQDLGDRHRTVLDEHRNEVTTRRGVALAVTAQAGCSDGVDIARHVRRRYLAHATTLACAGW